MNFEDMEGWVSVYDVGSNVARRDNQGVLHDMKVVGHEFMVFEDKLQLFYIYNMGKSMKAMTSEESIHAIGDEWTMVYLNRKTGEKRQSLEDDMD